MVTKLVRSGAWLLLVIITTLSLVPPHYRPITPVWHHFEHSAIFMGTGLAFGLGYRFLYVFQAAGLITYVGAIEVAQLWIPGRHARMGDFVVDAVSASVGVLIAWLSVKMVQCGRPKGVVCRVLRNFRGFG
jgi:VanZ family protein